MQYTAFAVVAVFFAAGVIVARTFAPRLANTREGRVAAWVVAALVGAAAAVAADHVWMAVRAFTAARTGVDFGPSGAGGFDEGVVTSTLRSILLESGSLLGLAAIAHLLAPAAQEAPVAQAAD